MTLPKNVDGLKLTPTEKEIALALIEPKIKDLTVPEVGLFMEGIILKTFLNSGGDVKKNKEVIDLTIDELISDLMKYNGLLSLSEIKIAFTNGYKGEYGEYFGLNNKTYFQWVNAYCFGEKRLRVRKTLLDAKNNEGKEPEKKKPEEIDYIMKEACLKSFDDYRKGSIIFDAGNVKYNFLVKMEVLNFTEERKLAIQKIARERLKAQAIETKGKSESISKVLDKISPQTLISESKKDCLIAFFKDLTETETELKELLN